MCDLRLRFIASELFRYREIGVSRQVQDQDKTKSEPTTTKGKLGTPGPTSNREGKSHRAQGWEQMLTARCEVG